MTDPSSSDSQAKLEAALVDYLERAESGDVPDHDQFLGQYPELRDELSEFLSNRERLFQAASRLRERDGVADDPTVGPAVDEPSARRMKIRYFGDYEILDEIARGGMGVVYRARQATLKRVVALKMILAGQLAGDEDVKRFYAEAEAAAKLDHPYIVPVFEIGQHEGQHYFSMAYIDGQSLARRVASGPLPPREAAQLAKSIAEAVAYAHVEGVIHRDLKPANVLLDRDGQPRVTDFGLSKRITSETQAIDAGGLTQTGQLLGSPSYMAPEQAAGRNDVVGPRSDVYAMGATLYCLLTGRPPFQAASPVDTLMQVVHSEPVSVRQLNSRVPRDLDRICLKCLEKDPRRRYGSAHEMLDDLNRFLDGHPVKARPNSPATRVIKWSRRRPATAALVGVMAVGVIVAWAAGLWFNVQVRRERDVAEQQRQLARERLGVSLREQARAERIGGNRTRAIELITEAVNTHPTPGLRNEAIQTLVSPGAELRHKLEFGHACTMEISPDGTRLAVHGRFQAGADENSGDPPFQRDDRLVVWRLPDARLEMNLPLELPATNLGLGLSLMNPSSFSQYKPFAFSSRKNQLAISRHEDGKVEFWHQPARAPYLTMNANAKGPVVFSADGTLAAVMITQDRASYSQVWDLDRGEAVGHALLGQPLLFVSSEELLVSDKSRIRRVDFRSGDIRFEMPESSRLVAISRNGHTAAFSSASNLTGDPIVLWDVVEWQELATLENVGSIDYRQTFELQFSPDGRLLAFHHASEPNAIKIWDRETRGIKASFPGQVYAGDSNWNQYQVASFSPNGRFLIAYSRRGGTDLRLWDIDNQRICAEFPRDHSPQWSPDGRWLVTLAPHAADQPFGEDRVFVRVWKVLYPAPGVEHRSPIDHLQFDPVGRRLAVNEHIYDIVTSASATRLERVTLNTQSPLATLGPERMISSIRFPTGSRRDQQFEVVRWLPDQSSKMLAGPEPPDVEGFSRFSSKLRQVGRDSSGRWLAIACEAWHRMPNGGNSEMSHGGCLALWDLESEQASPTWQVEANVSSVSLSHDGVYVAATNDGSRIDVWETVNGNKYRHFTCEERWTSSERLEKGFTSRMRVSDAMYQYEKTLPVHHFDLSHDNSRLYAATDGGRIFVFEVVMGERLDTWTIGDRSPIKSVAAHPNGEWLAAGSDDRSIRLIDVSSGEVFAEWQAHASGVTALDWSADGRWLASGSVDGSAHVWDVRKIRQGLRALKLDW